MSQCTTKHCHDGDRDVSALTALVDRLQDTVERQVDSLEQQQRQNQELQGQLATLKETVKTLNETMYLQEKRLMINEDTLGKQNESTYNFTFEMYRIVCVVAATQSGSAIRNRCQTRFAIVDTDSIY